MKDVPAPPDPQSTLGDLAREGLLAPEDTGTAESDGASRVDLSFTVQDKSGSDTQRKVRVPAGVPVFDSASWNGIAIDSTCGGHGTCRKCKVRVGATGDPAYAAPITSHDRRTFSEGELADGWRLACLVQAVKDLDVTVPPLMTRPKAATVGVGRQVILRPAVQKRYVELAEPTLGPAHRPGAADRRDRRPGALLRAGGAAPAAGRAA